MPNCASLLPAAKMQSIYSAVATKPKQPKPSEPDADTLLAIAKAVKEKAYTEARAQVTQSQTPINSIIQLTGVLTVAADLSGTGGVETAGAFDPWGLLLAAMERLDISAAELAEIYAKRVKKDAAGVAVAAKLLPVEFMHHTASLPRVMSAGSPGRRGAVSFAGVIQAL